MAEVRDTNTNGTSDAANAKKRRGFWSNIFGRSSNHPGKNKDQQQPNKGFMDSLARDASQAATKELMHVAEREVTEQVKAHSNGSSGSSPADANSTAANVAPDASTTTPSDVLSAPTSWAQRMVDSAQQKVQSLQNLAS